MFIGFVYYILLLNYDIDLYVCVYKKCTFFQN